MSKRQPEEGCDLCNIPYNIYNRNMHETGRRHKKNSIVPKNMDAEQSSSEKPQKQHPGTSMKHIEKSNDQKDKSRKSANVPKARYFKPLNHRNLNREIVEIDEDNFSKQEGYKIRVKGLSSYVKRNDFINHMKNIVPCIVSKLKYGNALLLLKNKDDAEFLIGNSGNIMFLNRKLYFSQWDETPVTANIVKPDTMDFSGDFYMQVEALMKQVRMTEEDSKRLELFFTDLNNALSSKWPGSETLSFGSIVSGLGVKGSDVDCYVNLPPEYDQESTYVTAAKKVLEKYSVENMKPFCRIFAITKAKTPIVKFYHSTADINCDLNFVNKLGVQNSELIKFWISLDKRLLPFLILVKYWGKIHEISGNKGISNYALCMIAFFYLQQEPNPIIPSIVDLQRDPDVHEICQDWNCGFSKDTSKLPKCTNQMSLIELLQGFFKFVSDFNYSDMVMCLYTGKITPKTDFIDINKVPEIYSLYIQNIKEQKLKPFQVDQLMCVQDPFEHSHNISRCLSHRTFYEIIEYFKLADKICTELKENKSEDLIKRLYTEKPILNLDKKNSSYRITLPENSDIRKIGCDTVKEILRDIFSVILKCDFQELENVEKGKKLKEKHREAIICYIAKTSHNVWDGRSLFSKTVSENQILSDTIRCDTILHKEQIISEKLIKLPSSESRNYSFEVKIKYYPSSKKIILFDDSENNVRVKEFSIFCKTFVPYIFKSLAYEKVKLIESGSVGEPINNSEFPSTPKFKSINNDMAPKAFTKSLPQHKNKKIEIRLPMLCHADKVGTHTINSVLSDIFSKIFKCEIVDSIEKNKENCETNQNQISEEVMKLQKDEEIKSQKEEENTIVQTWRSTHNVWKGRWQLKKELITSFSMTVLEKEEIISDGLMNSANQGTVNCPFEFVCKYFMKSHKIILEGELDKNFDAFREFSMFCQSGYVHSLFQQLAMQGVQKESPLVPASPFSHSKTKIVAKNTKLSYEGLIESSTTKKDDDKKIIIIRTPSLNKS